MKKNALQKSVSRVALLTAAGLVVSWLEFLLIPPLPVPGVKLGLANVAVLAALEVTDRRSALLVCALRVVLASALFGSPVSMLYALSGALCAFCVMALLLRWGKFSLPAVSAAGGCAHNAAQLAAAYLATGAPGLISYLPVLIVSGVATGLATGFAACPVIRILKKQ